MEEKSQPFLKIMYIFCHVELVQIPDIETHNTQYLTGEASLGKYEWIIICYENKSKVNDSFFHRVKVKGDFLE